MKASFFDIRENLAQIKELQYYILKNQCLQIPEKALQEILTIFNLIREKIDTHHIYRKEIIQHYFYILFYNFYAFVKEQKIGKQEEKRPLKEVMFERFIAAVEQHYKTQHEIGFYAEKLCLTSKYLSALVHEISGKSAADWIKEYLLLEARTLLKSGKMTIQQVSNELNFNDQSYFGVFFKRYMGCSPREYQKM
jgi:AraC-like DNA-binding protein